jgi:hypothetical protein
MGLASQTSRTSSSSNHGKSPSFKESVRFMELYMSEEMRNAKFLN